MWEGSSEEEYLECTLCLLGTFTPLVVCVKMLQERNTRNRLVVPCGNIEVTLLLFVMDQLFFIPGIRHPAVVCCGISHSLWSCREFMGLGLCSFCRWLAATGWWSKEVLERETVPRCSLLNYSSSLVDVILALHSVQGTGGHLIIKAPPKCHDVCFELTCAYLGKITPWFDGKCACARRGLHCALHSNWQLCRAFQASQEM